MNNNDHQTKKSKVMNQTITVKDDDKISLDQCIGIYGSIGTNLTNNNNNNKKIENKR